MFSSSPCPPEGMYIIFFLVASYCFFPNSIALSTLPFNKGVNVPSSFILDPNIITKSLSYLGICFAALLLQYRVAIINV